MKSLAERVVHHNSYETNVICCIEEMSELIKVLCKEQRKSPKFNQKDFVEELSHVMLMCEVLRVNTGLDYKEVYSTQKDAVERMETGK